MKRPKSCSEHEFDISSEIGDNEERKSMFLFYFFYYRNNYKYSMAR